MLYLRNMPMLLFVRNTLWFIYNTRGPVYKVPVPDTVGMGLRCKLLKCKGLLQKCQLFIQWKCRDFNELDFFDKTCIISWQYHNVL